MTQILPGAVSRVLPDKHHGNSAALCTRPTPEVYSCGCYTFSDFPKVGFGIVIIVGFISVGFVELLIIK